PDKTPRFYTSVGAASAGVLLAFGISSLVGAIKEPLAAGLIGAVNALIKWQHWQMSSLPDHSFIWSFQVGRFVAGLLIIALVLKIAFWLAKKKVTRPQ
ncbi:MAG TPA: hypothetical protein VJ723_14530, partial [Candidatus Angelobacter sp.]|nr:hypothetical protein [Candidatus Angelobacter sp.]